MTWLQNSIFRFNLLFLDIAKVNHDYLRYDADN